MNHGFTNLFLLKYFNSVNRNNDHFLLPWQKPPLDRLRPHHEWVNPQRPAPPFSGQPTCSWPASCCPSCGTWPHCNAISMHLIHCSYVRKDHELSMKQCEQCMRYEQCASIISEIAFINHKRLTTLFMQLDYTFPNNTIQAHNTLETPITNRWNLCTQFIKEML